MPSLFSRVRTASTPSKVVLPADPTSPAGPVYDELGRIVSRGSTVRVIASLSSKKDKPATPKKDKAKGRKGPVQDDDEPSIPDGSFLPLCLEPRARQAPDQADREQDYGYLSYQRHIVLGLEEVHRLVRALTEELGNRGLTTPFIFSSLALDVSAQGVRRLINAFLRTCVPFPVNDAEHQWREEVRFAGPHQLGMGLRWGLARVVRVVGGNAVRGFIPWENYLEWAEAEVALNYPPTHFGTFLEPFDPLLRGIIFNVLSLLARLTAHSASSGHTPPTLSPLFGPLLFGLGSPALAFQHAYVHYLRATNAMEHLLLAFVRWQDAPSNDSTNSIGTGSAASLGVPARLKDWIRGYPSMLPERAKKQDRLTPRRGARTVRVISVRRNVRMYTPDLVKSASTWAGRLPAAGAPGATFGASKEWERVTPPTLKLPPRYSDAYRKRMDLPANFHPQTATAGSSASTTSSGSSSLLDDDYFGLGKEDERFKSLTDLKWGEFEVMGFGGLGSDEKKLQFDLTESARTARAAKRTTLTWTDFSTTGFSRTDAPLNATLEFSVPVSSSIQAWPEQQDEIRRKLKKTQRGLPPFGWDTEPVMGPEEVIEEAFIDVFCDLVYGGGWMDFEREEDVDRECNWALVEYRSLPVGRSMVPGGADPRTSTSVFLFEEFVPFEYRQQLSAGVQNKRRIPFLFSTSKSKPWKPAATLNGRPYVVGATPTSPSVREVEFEGLLRGNQSMTKVIHFDRSGTPRASTATQESASVASDATARAEPTPPPKNPATTTKNPATTTTKNPATMTKISAPLYVGPRDTDLPSPLRAASPSRRPRFRLPMPGSSSNRTSGLPPSEYEDVDFETRLASTDELAEDGRRRSKDDAWVDILVANHGRRMAGQDVEIRARPVGARPLPRTRSDPEEASIEVARALAGVRPMSEAGDDDAEDTYGGIEPMTVPHRSEMDADDARTPADATDEDEDDQEPQPATRRRLGYFDLHPDRRRGGGGVAPENGRRPSSAESASSDEVPYPSVLRRADSAGASSIIDVPDMRLPSSAEPGVPARTDSMTLGGLVDITIAAPVPKPAAAGIAPGRTAALIEMYKQRDAAAAAGPPSPARGLPRTPKDRDILPPPPAPASEAEPEPEPADGITPEDLEPPSLEKLTAGRESPYRYVHGAPLHNVTEEEEEEY
ncbi:hypothetical protein K488DRAFT_77022 [Vararia minispora EC-137]|uniref:Uncharacterized protein n=1 Tax=Vararia minispora EC-137 TaxID=1314806 RepID=A0ACB8QSY1_9AGAM|nr:hypothetical protein K488DRAFT_77022 [Vararia minispora EC-137]